MSANFDLSNLALQAACPNNEILYDDQGMPSVMVKIPKCTFADLGLGTSTATFPAFIVNGQEVNEIYISKFMNIVKNNRGYSLPGQDYANSMTFDRAIEYCANKGSGWHLMTVFEWGLLINWCERNGFIPLGNCNNGKWHTETAYKAIPMTKTSTGTIMHTAVGTGPLTWFHDQTLSGIADLCGDGFEWTGGIRNVYGELQILVNNNAADSANAQNATASTWMAINASDGTLITPNGSGTTSGSIKLDYVSSKIQFDTTITNQSNSNVYTAFKDITCTANISDAAKTVLRALGLLPRTSSLITTYSRCYINNGIDECVYGRGGSFTSSDACGFASFFAQGTRNSASAIRGFRAAFVNLPAA